ncbi:MAG: hypothetical protein AAF715_26360 [Myxococcota bacterium]
MKLRRRTALAGTAAWAASAGLARNTRAEATRSPHWTLRDIDVPGERDIGRRFTLLIPTAPRQEPVPLLVALHGLGETHDQRVGAYAWVERYGLGSSYDRLCTPPVKRVSRRARHWTDARLAEVNAMLKAQPFRGLAIACPYTPNVYRARRGRQATLDRYASWLVEEVVPRARREAGASKRTYLDGCSLGGYVGMEVFLRQSQHFDAWGCVQGALGLHRVAGYAERLAARAATEGAKPLHLETSTGDPFKSHHEALSKHLRKAELEHEMIVPPGPHNQPFLRDSGTLEMLLWHDRLAR